MPDKKPKKDKKSNSEKITLGPSSGIVKLRNTRIEEIEQYGNKGKKT